jgi:gas vesicle protein
VNDHADFSNSRIVASFVAGGLTGAAVALLLAPHSGRGTRSLINRTIQDGLDRRLKAGERFASKGRGVLEGASNYLGKQRKDLEQRRRDRMEADRQLKDEAGL